MKCIDDHHSYQLSNFENKETWQPIMFIKKEPPANSTHVGELRTVHDGTTNEEVLEMLIHRMQGLYTKFPSRETAIAITHCETALMFLEKRTRDRIKRGVEGKHIA